LGDQFGCVALQGFAPNDSGPVTQHARISSLAVCQIPAEYALVIHRSARIADGAQIRRFGVTGAESPMHQPGGGRRFSRRRRLAMVSA